MKMKKIFILLASLFGITLLGGKSTAQDISEAGLLDSANIYKYKVLDIDKEEIELAEYEGKVLLIVNVASKCGNTPQYEGLENIYRKYKPRGFEILAFPCNDFGQQEPGSNEEIQNFCTLNYDVTFQLFDKITVKGESKAPLYQMLTNNPVTGKSDIRWNFEKFLIDRSGNVVRNFGSKTKPENDKIISVIDSLLNN